LSNDPSHPVHDRGELDGAISTLRRNVAVWAGLSIDVKIGFARAILAGAERTAGALVTAAAAAKGVPVDSPSMAEEWLSGPCTLARTLRILIRSIEGIRERGTVPIRSSRVRVLPDGLTAVEVLPGQSSDRILHRGFRAEVRMQPGVHPGNLRDNVAATYRHPPTGRVSLVLGAGNVESIPPLDTVQKLFLEGSVVLLKLNPVNGYLKPFLEKMFADLIREGFVRIVTGGAAEGTWLCNHDGIDEIHLTGGEATYDAIVFGTGKEGRERKRRSEPLLAKRVTCELGNVGPVIVVPGRWSAGDIRFHAENVASQIVLNGGFYCNCARVVVTHGGWPQREEYIEALGDALRAAPPRPAYYPGAADRYRRFVDAHPGIEVFGEPAPGSLPPALARGLDPSRTDDIAFTTEAFCNVAGETAITASDPGEFLDRAVDFCNRTLRGTLNACVLVHPRTRRKLGSRFDGAISDLRYGAVGINHWPALCYSLGSTTWGAFPGHTPEDIQSGVGTVHNALLFDRPRNSIVDGPFRVLPKPVWFAGHGNALKAGRRLAAFEAGPSALKLAGILAAASLP
jgi:hypothetical protein